KTFAFWMRHARKLAREFQAGVDDMIRQAELEEAKQAVEEARQKLNRDIENAVDPTGEVKQAFSDNAIEAAPPAAPALPPTPSTTTNGSTPPQAGNGHVGGEGQPASAPASAPATPDKSG